MGAVVAQEYWHGSTGMEMMAWGAGTSNGMAVTTQAKWHWLNSMGALALGIGTDVMAWA